MKVLGIIVIASVTSRGVRAVRYMDDCIHCKKWDMVAIGFRPAASPGSTNSSQVTITCRAARTCSISVKRKTRYTYRTLVVCLLDMNDCHIRIDCWHQDHRFMPFFCKWIVSDDQFFGSAIVGTLRRISALNPHFFTISVPIPDITGRKGTPNWHLLESAVSSGNWYNPLPAADRFRLLCEIGHR